MPRTILHLDLDAFFCAVEELHEPSLHGKPFAVGGRPEERGVVPRGVDREVVEAMHRTHIGDDQQPEHILHHAIRTALADGWGGSMIATDISDILFNTPSPRLGHTEIVRALDEGADVVVTGRVADASLFAAPVSHAHGWRADDWPALAGAP